MQSQRGRRMTDQEIVGALVEAGILVRNMAGNRYRLVGSRSGIYHGLEKLFGQKELVWPIAGACLERLTPELLNRWIRYMKTAYVTDLLKDPRAICEAFAASAGQ